MLNGNRRANQRSFRCPASWTVLLKLSYVSQVAGLAVLGLALWLRFDTNMNQSGTTNAVAFATGTYALMGAGVLSGLIGFLGFCGALRESQSLLGSVTMKTNGVITAERISGFSRLDQSKTGP